jgi:fructose-1-phosphate kinase PfkB-like protein
MARIITVTANPLLDHLVPGLPVAGQVLRVPRIARIAGGKGVNVARVLARHGHQVVATGFAGGSEGTLFSELVAADGIEPAFLATTAPLRVGFQAVGERGTAAALEDGFPVTVAEVERLLRRVGDLARDADLVIVSGSVPDPRLVDLYRKLLDILAEAEVPCWLDAYGPAMDAALAGRNPPVLAKPNREEYAGFERRWLSCRELHLTDGKGAITVRSPVGMFRVVPPPVAEVNPVGSGDSYLAALAHARLEGLPMAAQLAYAAAAGAANAARADVAAIGPAEIQPLVHATLVETSAE